MEIFKIPGGRKSFYQWDNNQKILVLEDDLTQVHFALEEENALVCPVYESDGVRVADVPNVLLQRAGILRVYAVLGDSTLCCRTFRVNGREKPDDYIYTETEVWTAEQAVAQALQEAKDKGDFKGDPGPKGEAGVVKFTVVNELPRENIEDAIYLVPVAESEEDNLFDEYIFVDGKWEKIGSTAVQVDLTDYVKNTDIATNQKAGLVKVNSNYGVQMYGDLLVPVPAETPLIDAKENGYRAITPKFLDYAVRVGLTTNTIALTDAEKAAACGWLGTGVIAVGEDGTLCVKLADGSIYKVAAVKEE